MAIAGGACSAYWVQFDAVEQLLLTRSTTRLRSECTPVEEAVRRLRSGEAVAVAGSDMAAVRRAMRSDADGEG